MTLPSVKFLIDGNSAIQTQGNDMRAGITVTNSRTGTSSSALLYASGDGGDPVWISGDGLGYYADGSSSGTNAWCEGDKCTGAALDERVNAGGQGGEELPYLQKCNDTQRSVVKGHGQYRGKSLPSNAFTTDAAITWQYIAPDVIPTMARMGGYGTEVSQKFQNLKGTVLLYPARTNASVSYASKDGANLISAASGANGEPITLSEGAPVNEQIPRDIANLALPDNAGHFTYIGKIKGAGFNIPLTDCGGSCPGYAGTGTYLLVKATNAINYLTITNRQTGGGSYTKYFSNGEANNQNVTCPNGDTERTISGVSWASSCHGAKKSGNGGAVIVIW